MSVGGDANQELKQHRLVGCILGTAVGDAIGLPYEGLSPRRALSLLGPPTRYRFLFGRGMVSDDTEHTCIVAQSLISAAGDLDAFRQSLAWRLRWWLLGLPAGAGIATLRSIFRLWVGISPERSGVFSAGNGPAMRAAVLGVAIEDRGKLRQFVRVSTRITHTDPKAEYGAFAVALAARMVSESNFISGDEYLQQLRASLGDEASELCSLIASAVAAATAGLPTKRFADSLGLARGVSGYMYHSVPVAIHAWLLNPHDFRSAVTSVVECGGDADSTAAMVGGIVGTAVCRTEIPKEWIDTLGEWPRTVSWMEQLGVELGSTVDIGSNTHPPHLPVLGLVARNIFFLVVVLVHGFRRLAPPY